MTDQAPTLRQVMRRPRWIGMLVLCVVVASIFAWLLQWQLVRAIDTQPVAVDATEQVLPIDEVVAPGEYLNEPLVGQKVTVSGRWIAEDFLVVSSRFNDDLEGYWVTGQLRVEGPEHPTSLAVAIGWAPDRADAERAAAALAASATASTVDLVGRVVSDEGPQPPPSGTAITEMIRMSPAALLNLWHDTEVSGGVIDTYRPFLASDDPTGGVIDAGIVAISSPAPEVGGPINWLNLFYAIEWAIFIVFSFYLWYRLARDAWERECEELEGLDPDEA